jgi:hypothetical protein
VQHDLQHDRVICWAGRLVRLWLRLWEPGKPAHKKLVLMHMKLVRSHREEKQNSLTMQSLQPSFACMNDFTFLVNFTLILDFPSKFNVAQKYIKNLLSYLH